MENGGGATKSALSKGVKKGTRTEKVRNRKEGSISGGIHAEKEKKISKEKKGRLWIRHGGDSSNR